MLCQGRLLDLFLKITESEVEIGAASDDEQVLAAVIYEHIGNLEIADIWSCQVTAECMHQIQVRIVDADVRVEAVLSHG